MRVVFQTLIEKTDGPCNPLPRWENRTVKIKEWGWVENDMEKIRKH